MPTPLEALALLLSRMSRESVTGSEFLDNPLIAQAWRKYQLDWLAGQLGNYESYAGIQLPLEFPQAQSPGGYPQSVDLSPRAALMDPGFFVTQDELRRRAGKLRSNAARLDL